MEAFSAYMSVLAAFSFVVAAFWALEGTNAQAAVARVDFVADSDPLISQAARS